MLPITTHTHDFEGEPLQTLIVAGRPAWVARQIGARLGYSHGGKRLPNKVLGEWAAEFVEGKDYAVLRGEELAAWKALNPDAGVAQRTHRGLLVLFESGLHLVLVKTQQPVGRRLPRFLVDQVLPQLVRTGAYRPDGAREPVIVSVEVDVGRGAPSLPVRREERLALQAVTRERWVDLCDRKLKVEALERTLLVLGDRVDDDTRAAFQVAAAEIATGEDLSALKPEVGSWRSPSTIAAALGVSVQRLGRIITRLGLRGDPRFSRRVLNKARSSDRVVVTFVYNADAETRIGRVLRGDEGPTAADRK